MSNVPPGETEHLYGPKCETCEAKEECPIYLLKMQKLPNGMIQTNHECPICHTITTHELLPFAAKMLVFIISPAAIKQSYCDKCGNALDKQNPAAN